MPDPSDITAEEILRLMIRERIGSTDPAEIALAEQLRKHMGAIATAQGIIASLEEVIRAAADSAGAATLAPEEITQLREVMAGAADIKSALEGPVVGAWNRGYDRAYEEGLQLGMDAGGARRKRVLATVTDLASRLPGHPGS